MKSIKFYIAGVKFQRQPSKELECILIKFNPSDLLYFDVSDSDKCAENIISIIEKEFGVERNRQDLRDRIVKKISATTWKMFEVSIGELEDE